MIYHIHPDYDETSGCLDCGRNIRGESICKYAGGALCVPCAITKFKRRTRTAWVTAAFAAALYAAFFFLPPSEPSTQRTFLAFEVLVAAYGPWATVWAFPVAWTWWRRLCRKNPGKGILFGMFLGWLWFPYALYGGGIYQYLKARKLLKRGSSGPQ